MHRIYSAFFIALLVPAITFGQGRQTFPRYNYDNMQYDNSVLSIFSETGEPFYLVLNGIRQNVAPQSKIRV